MNPVAMENAGEKHDIARGKHIALSQIDTLHCQRKELEHRGGQR